MIVATAGHVDHGKTTLVKALTGADTDRLPEEKRRGMSIDLGFAYADFGGASPMGFVDVPGHERFVRNMLAGVAAVDFALLVIAADDGPMPQTREHLAILDLLGLNHGAVAITKVDRVSPHRLDEVQREVAALLATSGLRDAPVFPMALPSGEGVPALRAYLMEVQRTRQARLVGGNFRLAVDRCFTKDGAGLVVTGAVVSGVARVGDQLIVSPHGISVRVRSVHAQNRVAESACAGQRCALNLVGIGLQRSDVARGDWIVAPPAHVPTARLDVRLSVLGSESRPLAHWTSVHLHIGAAALSARVAILGARSIAPGTSGLAQLVFEEPIGAWRADRFIVRDQSAQRTIAGGMVLDSFGPTRGRSRPERLAHLLAMEIPVASSSLMALLDGGALGVNLTRFAQAWNLTSDEMDVLQRTLPIKVVADGTGLVALTLVQWDVLQDALHTALGEWHTVQPESLGLTETALWKLCAVQTGFTVLRAAVKSLLADGRVVREGMSLRLPGHRASLSAQNAELLEKVSVLLQVGGLRPPIVGELAAALGMELPLLLEFLQRVSALGHLVRIAKNRFFLPETVSTLGQLAQVLATESVDGKFDAAQYRDRSGIGRNLTIQVLEFLDRAGITQLVGERRFMQA